MRRVRSRARELIDFDLATSSEYSDFLVTLTAPSSPLPRLDLRLPMIYAGAASINKHGAHGVTFETPLALVDHVTNPV